MSRTITVIPGKCCGAKRDVIVTNDRTTSGLGGARGTTDFKHAVLIRLS